MKRKILGGAICLLLLCLHSNVQAQSGVYIESGSAMHNSIIWGNVDSLATSNQLSNSGTLSYTAVQGAAAPVGTGNVALSSSPFIGTGLAQEIYGLAKGAATINAGANAQLNSTHLTDAAGYARTWNTTVDMGAYEYQFPRTLVVNIDNALKYYGHQVELSYSLSGDALLPIDSVDVQLVTSNIQHPDSVYPIEAMAVQVYRLGAADVSNQYDISVVKGSLKVLPLRSIAITAQDAKKHIGENDPNEFTYTTTSDLIAGDSLVVEFTRAAGEAIGKYTIDTSSIRIFEKATGLSTRSHYNISVVKGTFTINPLRTIIIEAQSEERYLGENDPALRYTLTGDNLADGDSLIVQLARTAGESVNVYSIDTTLVRLFAKANELSTRNRYIVKFTAGTFTILPLRNIVIEIQDTMKLVGEDDPELIHVVTGDDLIDGDSIVVQIARTIGEDANTYDIDTLSVHIFNKLSGESTKHRYIIDVVKGAFTIVQPTAVGKNTLAVTLYPTILSNGILHISGLENAVQTKVEVYSVSGALLMHKAYGAAPSYVNLSAMPNGTLFVRILSGGKSATVQVVKQ